MWAEDTLSCRPLYTGNYKKKSDKASQNKHFLHSSFRCKKRKIYFISVHTDILYPYFFHLGIWGSRKVILYAQCTQKKLDEFQAIKFQQQEGPTDCWRQMCSFRVIKINIMKMWANLFFCLSCYLLAIHYSMKLISEFSIQHSDEQFWIERLGFCLPNRRRS